MNETVEELFELVERAKKGSHKHQSELYRVIKPITIVAVSRYMRGRRSFSKSDTEDLSQEIIISIFKGLKTLKETRLFKPWMNQVIKHKLFDFLRKMRIQESRITFVDNVDFEGKDLLDNSINFLEVDLADEFEHNYDREILVKRLCGLFKKVPSQFLLAMKEIHILKKTYEAVSLEHNLKIGTVKSRCSRGRETLARLYLESGLNLL
jgi:RNA polymerase sigma factor (sigma-70 family)